MKIPFLTIQGAADTLGVKPETITLAIHNGELAYECMEAGGGMVRHLVRRSMLEKFRSYAESFYREKEKSAEDGSKKYFGDLFRKFRDADVTKKGK